MEGQGNFKVTSRQGETNIEVKARHRKHNINLNYNLMGFDTIEINLVLKKMNQS